MCHVVPARKCLILGLSRIGITVNLGSSIPHNAGLCRPARPIDRPTSRRAFAGRDLSRTHEHQLFKDERRRLFEQQYEDEEKVNRLSSRRESQHFVRFA